MLKRFLLAALLLVGLLVAAFVAVGLTTDEVVYTNEVVIDRPIDEVWSVFADESRATEWVQSLESMETVSGDPMTVGTRTRLVFDENGQRVEVMQAVTAVDPPNRFAFDTDVDIMQGRTDVALTSVDEDTTRLRSTSSMRSDSLVLRVFMRLALGQWRDRAQGDFERLAGLVESSGT